MNIVKRKKSVIADIRGTTMRQESKSTEKVIIKTRFLQNRITERGRKNVQHKQTKEELKYSFSLLRAIFDSTNDGILVVDQQGKAINSNKRFQEMWDIPEALILLGEDEKLLEYVCNQLEKPEAFLSGVKKLYAHPEVKSYDILELKDGRFFERYSSPQIIGSEIIGRVWNFRDITERRQAEKELLESKTLIDAVVENVPLMIFLKEAEDLRFVVFNRAGEELLGYDRKLLLGKNNLDLFPSEQAANFMSKDREVLDGDVGMLDIPEESILTAKKGTRLLHTRKVCIRGADGITKYLLGISEDITEHKQMEDTFRKSNELFSLFMRHSPIYIYIKEVTPTQSVVLQASDNFLQMIGIPGSEMIGKSMAELFPPEFAAKMLADDQAVVSSGDVVKLEEEMNGRNYETIKFPIMQGDKTLLAGYTLDITTRKQAEQEIKKLNTELEERVALRTSQFLNANLGLLKEITVRKEYEEKLKTSLVEKELLLKEVNHRVKNNLQVISGMLGLQIMQSKNEEVISRLKDAQERINSMALLQGMLHQAENINKINFEEYINALIANLSHSYVVKHAELEVTINSPGIFLDITVAIPCALIINELMTNSLRHAFLDGKERKIWIDFTFDRRTNFYVISLRDNGIGLPDDFNSKKNTTLGLQLIEGLIKQLNGTITFQNNPGAQFTITFSGLEKEAISSGQDTDTNC